MNMASFTGEHYTWIGMKPVFTFQSCYKRLKVYEALSQLMLRKPANRPEHNYTLYGLYCLGFVKKIAALQLKVEYY